MWSKIRKGIIIAAAIVAFLIAFGFCEWMGS